MITEHYLINCIAVKDGEVSLKPSMIMASLKTVFDKLRKIKTDARNER